MFRLLQPLIFFVTIHWPPSDVFGVIHLCFICWCYYYFNVRWRLLGMWYLPSDHCLYFRTPSTRSSTVEKTLSLVHSHWKWEWGNSLVKTSTSWSLLEMKMTCRHLTMTYFQTKWKLISIYFVRAWKIGLVARYLAPRLSHHKVGVVEGEIWTREEERWGTRAQQ